MMIYVKIAQYERHTLACLFVERPDVESRLYGVGAGDDLKLLEALPGLRILSVDSLYGGGLDIKSILEFGNKYVNLHIDMGGRF